jgi:hypothetical protein
MNCIIENKDKFIKIEYDKKTIYLKKDIILSIELTINPGLSNEEKEIRNNDVHKIYIKAVPEPFAELVIYTSIIDERDQILRNVIEGRPYSKKYTFRQEGIEKSYELENLMSTIYQYIN